MSVVLDFEDGVSMADQREPDRMKAGTFHLACVDMEPLTTEQTGEEFGFRLMLAVGDGNVSGQVGKSFWQKFFYPAPSHKDGGKFCNKALAMLVQAMGLIAPGTAGKNQVDFGQLVDMQMVAKVKERKFKDEAGNEGATIEIDGLNMWHIDDPEVATIPKGEQFLANCCGIRWTPDMIATATTKHEKGASKIGGKGGGNGNGNGGAGAAGAGGKKPDYSNL